PVKWPGRKRPALAVGKGGQQPHRRRGIDEQGAAEGHLALELPGDELVAAGGDLPGDGARRVAGLVVAQVEQLAGGSGLAESVVRPPVRATANGTRSVTTTMGSSVPRASVRRTSTVYTPPARRVRTGPRGSRRMRWRRSRRVSCSRLQVNRCPS